MNSINVKFFNKFKRLETVLKNITGLDQDGVRFSQLIQVAGKTHPQVKAREGQLFDLYGLRNVIAHKDRDKYIAEVNKLALDLIDQTLEIIENPPKVGNEFGCDVFIADFEDVTGVVLKEMQENLFTNVPVYKNEKLLGMLTETTLLNWMAESIEDGSAHFFKRKIKDINPKFLNNVNNQYIIMSADMSIFDAYNLFEKYINDEKRLGAVLITSDGKKNSKPVGIITAWDLPRIKNYMTSS